MTLEERLKQGYALHRQGNLAEAERIYVEVLRQQPGNFNALHFLGVLALQAGQPQRGVDLISNVLLIDAQHAPAHRNLGSGLQDLKRYGEALASYDRAIALKPDYVEAHGDRANLLMGLGQPAEALTSYDKVIVLMPDSAQACNNRANALKDLNRPEEALTSYDKAIALAPDFAEAHSNRALALIDLKRPGEALASSKRAIALGPDFAEAHGNCGLALLEMKRHSEAVASCDKAIALKPDFAEAYGNRGLALMGLKQPEQALASYERAIALMPDYAVAFSNRGAALTDMNRLEEALESCDRAIALKPDYAEAYSNRGNALLNLKRPEEALASYDKAVALQPDFANAHWNQSFVFLLMGEFEQGWRQYEWRRKKPDQTVARSCAQPLWSGSEDISGKTLFLHWEQGLGDTIQFCRYAKLAAARGAKVILSVQEPLRGLLGRLHPEITVIGQSETPADFDYHCPLLSLPLAFGTRLQTIPSEARYISADEMSVARWRERLERNGKPDIGLVWSGSPDHLNDHNRSIPLETVLPLPDMKANWTSLQKDVRESDARALRANAVIKHYGEELRDFADTAALVQEMDLVITVDTSVAHLAGAMGKPVWILLPYNSDWRWLLDREDSPWYPGARLFRQQKIGNWTEVINRVKTELRSLFR